MNTDNNLDSLFEKQFDGRYFLETPFGKIETVDIIPKDGIHKTPVLLAPGWGETLELQKECLREVYLSGRRIIGLRHAVIIKKSEQVSCYPNAVLQKSDTILQLLREKKITKVDIISHSEGSINVTIAATIQPELFCNLVLVTPAGVSGKDNEARIIIGFLMHVWKTRAQFSQIKSSGKILKHMKNQKKKKEVSIWKRLDSFKQEINAMATINILPLLINLRKKGIKIAILAGETDTAFPLVRMKRHLERGIIAYNLQTEEEKKQYGLDIFATKKGGHELYLNIYEIMQQVLFLLNELQNR